MNPFLIGVCIGIYVSVAVLAASSAPREDYWRGRYLFKGIIGALWPLVGAVVLVCLPFLAVGWLGERLCDWIESQRK